MPVNLDLPVAQRIVARHDPRLVATHVTRLYGGTTDVFEIAISDDASPLVLKLYPDEPRWKPKKEDLVARLVGERLEAPAPKWLFTDETRALTPRSFALMSKLPGAPLRTRLGKREAPSLYIRMGRLLRELHMIAMKEFGYLNADGVVEPCATNAEYMHSAFEVKFRDFRAHGGDHDLSQRLQTIVKSLSTSLVGCATPVLCHNDFHPGNVLVDCDAGGDWRLSGLIDFENALAGDPLFDLAKALDYTAHEDPSGRAPLLEGYGPIDRAGAAEALIVYRIFHKLELWNWFILVGASPSSEGARNLLRDLHALTFEAP